MRTVHNFAFAIFLMLALAACDDGRTQPNLDAQTSYEPPAPIVLSCPKQGLETETLTRNGSIGSISWLGTAANDSATCLGHSSLQQSIRRLYGWYALPVIGEENIRAGMATVFAGAPGQHCFTFTPLSNDISRSSQYKNCWQQLGSTTIVIDGLGRNVIAFRQTSNESVGVTAGVWMRYFDPALGLFVKSDVIQARGFQDEGWYRRVIGGQG